MMVDCDNNVDSVLKIPRYRSDGSSNEDSSTAEDETEEVMMDDIYDHCDDPESNQLPNVEEYKANVPPHTGVENARKRFKIMCLSVGLLLLVTIILMVSLMSGKDSNSTGTSSTTDDQKTNKRPQISADNKNDVTFQDENEERFMDLLNMIGLDAKWSSLDDLNSPFTPQRKALTWLSHIDPLRLQPDATSQQLMQRYVLATLYYSLSGIKWRNDYDFLTGLEECGWSNLIKNGKNSNGDTSIGKEVGVICDTDEVAASTVITRLYMASNNLIGTLPTELQLLTALREINFYNNEISGIIPTEFANLSNLKSIVLHQNEIQDIFPTWITKLTDLKILNLGDNDIEGELPGDFRDLVSLTSFNCESCQLQGDLMPLYGMSQLESLHLGSNALEGYLTNEIFESWTNMIELDLGSNLLSGPLPNKLFSHPNLTFIDLHDNEFEGNLTKTDEMPDKSKLLVLALQSNFITGVIDPSFVTTLTDTQHLDLSENDFVGAIPTEFGNLTKLLYLFLSLNPFNEGTIPTEFGQLANLVDLSLQGTSRAQQIPTELGNLKRLVMLDLLDNKLTGAIPSELGNLSNVRYLLLGQNMLSGDIPTTLADLDNLNTLMLGSNKEFTSGIDEFCDVQTPRLFQADCNKLNTQNCTCCTCCLDEDSLEKKVGCLDTPFFFSNMDPNVEYNYVRQYYQFNEYDEAQRVNGIPDILPSDEFDDTDANKLFDNAPYGNNIAGPWEEYFDDQKNNVTMEGKEMPFAPFPGLILPNITDLTEMYDEYYGNDTDDSEGDDTYYEYGYLENYYDEGDDTDGVNGTP